MSNMQLRHVASVFNSNVDKIVDPNEEPVRLCNYVDVYKNDFISLGINFQVGSATPREIDRFGLRIGDVLITKDSEDRHDIGVPALVRETAPDLVCGYHLTVLRADTSRCHGGFLFWALQSKRAQEAFAVAASGVTRYGLTQDGIKSQSIWLPDLDSQQRIAAFLDTETARIDRLLELRQAFALKIAESRDALISELISGRESGPHRWLSDLPTGYRAERAKFHFRERINRSEQGEEELLTVSHLTGVTKRSEKNITMFLAESNEGYKLVEPGDLVINTMWAWMGAMGVSRDAGIISPSYGVYFRTSPDLMPDYLDLLVRSKPFVAEVTRRSKGIHSSRLRLYPDAFLGMLIPIPPMEKQAIVLDAIQTRAQREDRLLHLNEEASDRLREYRAALITEAVTGQLDIDAWRKRGSVDAELDGIAAEAGE